MHVVNKIKVQFLRRFGPKVRGPIQISVLLVFAISLTQSCYLSTKKIFHVDLVSPDSFQYKNLALYGEFVYERENCSKCHSQIYKKRGKKISLDGLSIKYSKVWHYHHLQDPRTVNPSSTMPSYSYLFENAFNKKEYSDFFKRRFKNGVIDLNENWKSIKVDARNLAFNFREEGITIKSPNEGLAIIAYLLSIPETNQAYPKFEPNHAQADSMIDFTVISELDENQLVARAEKQENRDQGKVLYESNCKVCHGINGAGSIAPNLTDGYWLHGGKTIDIIRSINEGIPAKGMRSWKSDLTKSQIIALTSYILSIQNTDPPDAKGPQGIKH